VKTAPRRRVDQRERRAALVDPRQHEAMGEQRQATRSERDDLVETLRGHRALLEVTARGLTDEQAAERPTVSELCIGGIIKHVTMVEANWADFIVNGPGRSSPPGEQEMEAHAASFRMEAGDTLEDLLARHHEVAAKTDELVMSYASLDQGHPLPPAPWFPPGTTWSARRTLLHIIAETAQHAGHADVIREAIDGQKSMG
jgi:Protein of unknown function (DUF664)